MPALSKTQITGEIVWLGSVDESAGTLRAGPVNSLELTFAGADGEKHSGLTRESCVRVKSLWPVGTQVRNVRQLSILSAEELEKIAAGCRLETLDPALLGANIVVRGIPDFTHLPPSSRLQGPNGVTLTVDIHNRPCVYPAREIEAAHPGHGNAFLATAKGLRGVTAWVEKEGRLQIGNPIQLFVPDQRAWMAQPGLFDT